MPYERRRPENGALHRVVRENLSTLYAATDDADAGAALPAFVRKELEGYLDCGLLCRGFAVHAATHAGAHDLRGREASLLSRLGGTDVGTARLLRACPP